MDITNSPSPTPTKSPDTENDTPPHAFPQPIKQFSFTNGTLKKHHHYSSHHHHHHPQPPQLLVAYRECLKNHAANMGGHALDGCGEFMPSPATNPTDPTSFKCAACGCHRNFHRRETEDSFPSTHILDFRHHPAPAFRRYSPSPSPSPPPVPPPQYASHMLLALSAAIPEETLAAAANGLHQSVVTPVTPTAVKTENLNGRKRFRTKFSQEQKEKMQSFSEKLGWKMQRCDDTAVQQFCNEIGVSKGVLKVWMHNNKNNFAKKDVINNGVHQNRDNNLSSSNIQHGALLSFENNNGGYSNNKGVDDDDDDDDDDDHDHERSTNGSRSRDESGGNQQNNLHASSTNGGSSST